MQNYINFLMLGVNKKSDFSLSDIKKIRHIYVLIKCPLVYSVKTLLYLKSNY